MTTTYVDVDVRPILRAGGEPFEQIMAAVNVLKPGEGLRLFATFKPTPLLHVLGSKGFTHVAKEIDGGEWEVVFSPSGTPPTNEASIGATAHDDTAWPEPIKNLDNRDLDPPEPMVKILATAESMQPGEVLAALLRREPLFLFPELAKRGHSWRGAFEADGKTYKVLVRIGTPKGSAA
jgi:TusA-related sulfurtransferase